MVNIAQLMEEGYTSKCTPQDLFSFVELCSGNSWFDEFSPGKKVAYYSSHNDTANYNTDNWPHVVCFLHRLHSKRFLNRWCLSIHDKPPRLTIDINNKPMTVVEVWTEGILSGGRFSGGRYNRMIMMSRRRYQIITKSGPECPRLMLPMGEPANLDTAQMVKAGKGQAIIARMCPSWIEIIPAMVAIPPVIISSG